MKTLLLLRHAKSSWDDSSLTDKERPLTARGQKAAPHMGRAMAARGWLPQAVLASPALRTRQTWNLVAAELPDPPAAHFSKKLYMASAETLLAEIKKTREAIEIMLLVGHNPGMEELARGLAGPGSDAVALDCLREKYPTATLARFVFEGSWKALGPAEAKLTDILRPKDLG